MRKGKTVGDEIFIAAYNSRNRTVSDGHLSEIFESVGRKYGYDVAGAGLVSAVTTLSTLNISEAECAEIG